MDRFLYLFLCIMHTLFTVSLLSEDESSNLARLDYASLSQQALMEMVIDEIKNKDKICFSKTYSIDIAEWSGITVDEDGNVTHITAAMQSLTGSFALEWLPPTVCQVFLAHNMLSGSAKLECLPEGLNFLNMSENIHTGTLCLDTLPDALEEIYLSSNVFTGSVNLTELPKSLQQIQLGHNKLSGTLDLTKLPEGLETIGLLKNSFSGETDLSHLPESLTLLDVSGNKDLCGHVPQQMRDNVISMDTQIEQL